MIQNVLQGHSAISSGYLATRGVATCIAVIATFVNSTSTFIEHISAEKLFADMPTINGTQRRLERIVRHIFQRAGAAAVVRSALLLGGCTATSYTTNIRAIKSRVTDSQLRNFLEAIIVTRLQLNPETSFIDGLGEIAYQVSIVVNIDHPNDSGRLMISQIREIGIRFSETLHMVILDARSGESLISGQQSIFNSSWSFYPDPISNEHRQLVVKMAMLMYNVERMALITQDEFFDAVDTDDNIWNDEEDDIYF
ncbi:unnamed protein product [Rotaria magnacalcarata]